MATKKRPAGHCAVAQSPMTRMTQEFGDAINDSCYQPCPESCTSQPAFCTPEYFSGDFCTPEDQMQNAWSQPHAAPQTAPTTYLCPPTPESSKRRKTKTQAHASFMYDLDSLPEADENDPPPTSCAQQRKTPVKSCPAPVKATKQKTLQESWLNVGSSLSATTGTGKKRVMGAKAVQKNPFLRHSLTAKELRTPSRPIPLLEGAAARPTRYMQDFEEISILGKGDFGEVYMVRSRLDGCAYAIKRGKVMPRKSTDKSTAFYEVFAMAAISGVSHCVRYHASWEQNDMLYIQMELCGGTLAQKSKEWGCRLDEREALKVLHQIGSALQGLHELGMVHMDVKAENIYMNYEGDEYRLGDFGLVTSEALLDDGLEPMEGDGRYAAPEAVAGFSQGVCVRLSPCDVYSLGASVLELCVGRAVDWGESLFKAVREGRPVEIEGFSAGMCHLLTDMLSLDPNDRVSAEELVSRARQLLGDGCTELERLRMELAALRQHSDKLERQLSVLNSAPNCSMSEKHLDTSANMDDMEPVGSQESPFHPLAQPIPPSPIAPEHDRSYGKTSPAGRIHSFFGPSV